MHDPDYDYYNDATRRYDGGARRRPTLTDTAMRVRPCVRVCVFVCVVLHPYIHSACHSVGPLRYASALQLCHGMLIRAYAGSARGYLRGCAHLPNRPERCALSHAYRATVMTRQLVYGTSRICDYY